MAKKTLGTKLAVLLASTLGALALAEVGLRLTGHGPPPRDEELKSQAMAEPDPITGWRFEPGTHRRPAYHEGGEEIVYTFLADGMRRSSPDQAAARDGRPVLLLIGGSFAQGFALTDREALGWQLQERLPQVEVRNWATGGFGTYQSLLRLDALLQSAPPPAVVVYGFIDLHEERNVGTNEWIRTLSRDWIGKELFLPYVSVGADGELLRQGTHREAQLPLRNASALARALEDGLRGRVAARREAQKREATRLLFERMAQACDARGVPFVVAFLKPAPDTNPDHLEFLGQRGIRTADCALPIPREHRVVGEGHPNGAHNALWVDCLAPVIEQLLPR
jgi:hypothetical protein